MSADVTMSMLKSFTALAVLVLTQPPEAIPVDERGQNVFRGALHWQPTTKVNYTETLRCRRFGGEVKITYQLDSKGRENTFYRIVSVSADGVQQSGAVIEQLNNEIYRHAKMPYILPQCFQREWRIYFGHWVDGKIVKEVIVPLGEN